MFVLFPVIVILTVFYIVFLFRLPSGLNLTPVQLCSTAIIGYNEK